MSDAAVDRLIHSQNQIELANTRKKRVELAISYVTTELSHYDGGEGRLDDIVQALIDVGWTLVEK